MSEQTTALPERVERKVTNRNGDAWYEYQGAELFDADTRDRLRDRFDEMRNTEYDAHIATVKGSSHFTTKIRTNDCD